MRGSQILLEFECGLSDFTLKYFDVYKRLENHWIL